MVIGSEKDRLLPMDRHSERFRGEIPGVQFRVMRGLGHTPMWDDAGQIAGNSDPGIGTDHPFLWEKGKMKDLGSLTGPANSAFARAMNSKGHVVGTSGKEYPIPRTPSCGPRKAA